MPKETRKQLTQREVVETQLDTSPRVIAPAQIQGAVPANSMQALGEALQGVSPQLRQALAMRQQRLDAEATRDARNFYASQGSNAPQGYADVNGDVFEDKSVAWKKAYMGLIAEKEAYNLKTQMFSEYEKLPNKEQQDIVAWSNEFIQGSVSGMDDPVFLEYTLKHLERSQQELMQSHQQSMLKEVDAEGRASAAQVARAKFSDNSLLNVNNFESELKRLETVGLAGAEGRFTLLESAVSASVAGGGRPELFDVFYKKLSDGSTVHSYMMKEVDAAKAHAEDMKKKREERAKKDFNLETKTKLEDLLKMETLQPGWVNDRTLQEAIDAGFDDEPYILNWHNRRAALLVAQQQQELLSNKFMNGESGFLNAPRNDRENIWGTFMQSRRAVNPEGAMNEILHQSVEVGELPPQFVTQLNSARPGSGNFSKDAELYAQIEGYNPRLTSQLNDEQSAIMSTYWDLQKYNQFTPEQAETAIKEAISKDNWMEARRAFDLKKGGEILKAAEDIASDGIDARNNLPYIERTIKRVASMYYALNQNPEQAVKLAKERFKNTHSKLFNSYLYTKNLNMSERQLSELEEAGNWYLKEHLVDEMKSAGKYYGINDYSFRPDPNKVSSRYWLIVDGNNLPTGKAIDVYQLIQKHKATKQESRADQIRSEQDRIQKLIIEEAPISP